MTTAEPLVRVPPFTHTYFDVRVRHACVACHWAPPGGGGADRPCAECSLPVCPAGRALRERSAAGNGRDLRCSACNLACPEARDACRAVLDAHAAECTACGSSSSSARIRRVCDQCATTWCDRCDATVAHDATACVLRDGTLTFERLAFFLAPAPPLEDAATASDARDSDSSEDRRLAVLSTAHWLHALALGFQWPAPAADAIPSALTAFAARHFPGAPDASAVAIRLAGRVALDQWRATGVPLPSPKTRALVTDRARRWTTESRGPGQAALALLVTLVSVDASHEAMLQALLAYGTYVQHMGALCQLSAALGDSGGGASTPASVASACHVVGLVHDSLDGYAYAAIVHPDLTPGALWARDLAGPAALINASYLITLLDLHTPPAPPPPSDATADARGGLLECQLLVHLFALPSADHENESDAVTVDVVQSTEDYGLGAWIEQQQQQRAPSDTDRLVPRQTGRAAVRTLAARLEQLVDPASSLDARADAYVWLTGRARPPPDALAGPFRLVTLRLTLNG